ncbi:MAG: serine/threonine protein kinase [Cyanobacteria bacterium J007]|nr:MAG: serine/threonine protein kinase [Cyanobacteria bacterium J007]
MKNFPDFTDAGYRVIRELGNNRPGGRVTYLAVGDRNGNENPANSTDANGEPENADEGETFVVIKQFQFAQSHSTWAHYDAFEREVQVLQDLNHPGIPRYLDSFQTADGLHLVQEYKPAESIAEPRPWMPVQIQQVAVSLLDILVYLQQRLPPVIHRDIKPENVLVDAHLNVYLVDFGFAHFGQTEVAASSLVKGTLGFMPPEQLFNRELTKASDLYGVGATLICLLSNTPSAQIGELIDENYRIHFRSRLRKIGEAWIQWLERIVEPKPKDRFPDAAAALAAVRAIAITPVPQAVTSHQWINLRSRDLNETLRQTVVITNSVPGTRLNGRWAIAKHPSDLVWKGKGHPWISVTPARFRGNRAECTIAVNTARLLAGETYERELLLRTNSSAEPYRLPLQVQTAPEPPLKLSVPYSWLAGLFGLGILGFWMRPTNFVAVAIADPIDGILSSGFLALLFLWTLVQGIQRLADRPQAASAGAWTGSLAGMGVGIVIGAIAELRGLRGLVGWLDGAFMGVALGVLLGAYAAIAADWGTERQTDARTSAIVHKLAGGLAGGLGMTWPILLAFRAFDTGIAFSLRLGIALLTGAVAGCAIAVTEASQPSPSPTESAPKKGLMFDSFSESGFSAIVAIGLTVGFGAGVGLALQEGLTHPGILFWLVLMGAGLAKVLYPLWRRSRFVRRYRQSKPFLIEP